MKRENIIGYLKEPARLDQSTLTEVEELVESYPYFQTARMLLARNHHNLDSLKFRDALRSAAAFAGDRTVLYHLINRQIPKFTGTDTRDHGITGTPETLETDTRGPGPAEDSEGIPSGILEDILNRETGDADLDFGPSYTLEESLESPASPGEDELEEKPPEEQPGKPPGVRSEEQTGVQPEGQAQVNKGGLEEYTFTGWFDHLGENPSHQGSDSPQKELIEKFLKDLPGISPDKDKNPDRTDRSEAYGVAGDSLMTETLAKIYIKQGMYRKAIHAYEKLSLKYPEKSTYFATQIKRIKRSLENE